MENIPTGVNWFSWFGIMRGKDEHKIFTFSNSSRIDTINVLCS